MIPDPVYEIEFLEQLPEMVDGELSLVLLSKVPPDHEKGFSPSYKFRMINCVSGIEMGALNLRVGYTHNDVNYRGNIGFSVHELFRGRNYAARSCRLLIPVIKHHNLNPVWFTCNDDNFASMKSIEKLGAIYVETVKIPDDYNYSWYYPDDSRVKRRYSWFI